LALLRAFSYFERVIPDEHGLVRAVLEGAKRYMPDLLEPLLDGLRKAGLHIPAPDSRD
jgi:hypothetical protein